VSGRPGKQARRAAARRYAVQALYQHQLADQPVAELLDQYLADEGMSEADADYFAELVRCCHRDGEALLAELGQWLDRPADQLDPVERAILLVGVYELRERAELPYRVVLNEAVELARLYGAEQSHTYVNGVLDKAARSLRTVEMESPRAVRSGEDG